MAPDVLAFADRKSEGAYPVTEPSGTVIARIRVSAWSGQRFEAVDAEDAPLCSGRRRSAFSGWWDAHDPQGEVLASLKPAFLAHRTEVRLPDERVLYVEGEWFGRSWALRDDSGHEVLTSVPSTGAWSFHPDAWIVRSHDTSLGLAQVVGVVELNRLMLKTARANG